jgi:hypothetical protein
LTALISMVIAAAFFALWLCTLGGIIFWSQNNKRSGGEFYAVAIFSIFYFYWAAQVIKNSAHLTLCGLFATYYFMGVSNGQTVEVPVKNPTLKSAKRAMTTSFGSNCYGSLLIAIISTLRSIAQQAKNDAASDGNIGLAICLCCLQCILSLIEDILEYFNTYAFAQVAIYGKDYCTAGKDTWQLFKSKGIDAIINDQLIGSVLGIGGLLVGAITTLITWGYLAARNIGPQYVNKSGVNQINGVFIAILVVSFLIGIAEFSIAASVVDSGVVATFVCL